MPKFSLKPLVYFLCCFLPPCKGDRIIIVWSINTSLMVPGVLDHGLQRHTACKIHNGCWGSQNCRRGLERCLPFGFWVLLFNFCSIRFLIRALLLWEKVAIDNQYGYMLFRGLYAVQGGYRLFRRVIWMLRKVVYCSGGVICCSGGLGRAQKIFYLPCSPPWILGLFPEKIKKNKKIIKKSYS